jgi:hypothetical protein
MNGSIGIIVILTSSLSVAFLPHRFGRLNSNDIIRDKPTVSYVIDQAVVDLRAVLDKHFLSISIRAPRLRSE